MEARSKIMADEFTKQEDTTGFYSLQLMEDLLDKEAKKLEKSLRYDPCDVLVRPLFLPDVCPCPILSLCLSS